MKIELIADYHCIVGESPIWSPIEELLYWCDIPTGRIFYYNPTTDKHGEYYKGEVTGGITIQSDGALLLFTIDGKVKLLRQNKLKTIIDGLPDEQTSRFNDIIADPKGRVFCGTMPNAQHLGRLYRLDTDGSFNKLLDGIGCSNGLGFSLDKKQMYYTDSPTRKIYVFNYDEDTGSIKNQNVFIHTSNEGFPDGMTIDAEGYIWSAFWDGGHIIRYSPDGEIDRQIDLPFKKPTSIAFGGKNFTDLYITSALGGNREIEGQHAGGLFRLRLGIQGMPEFLSKIGV